MMTNLLPVNPPPPPSPLAVMQVLNLSGGELQRVAITICLGVPADIYLIDEPSAYLDSEQRISASKVCARVCRPGGVQRGGGDTA